MPIQFMYGKAGADHLAEVADQVVKIQKENTSAKIYYLVPNHIKFQSEIQLLQRLRDRQRPDEKFFAKKDVQILSISRLAWFFLRNSSIYQYPRLTTSSTSMLLYRIILEHQDELILFDNIDAQLGLIKEISQQLVELKQGNVGPDDLSKIEAQFASDAETPMDLMAKIHDLGIIYTAYDEAIQQQFIDSSDINKALIQKLSQMDLSNETFIISGFSNFTAEEMSLIQTLATVNAKVVIDLVLNKYPLNEKLSENSLFYENERIVFRLNEWAHENAVNIEEPIKVRKSRLTPDMKELEQYWIESNEGHIKQALNSDNSAISVLEFNSRYAEVEQIATQIRQKMTNNSKLNFSDFSILTRHLDDYATIIKPIFDQFDIPIFYDLPIAMKNHPLLELLNALFDVKRRNYRYEDVMRLLKTGLLFPEYDSEEERLDFSKSIQITENYVLKQGIYGQKWLQKADWHYSRFNDESKRELTDEELEINRRINRVKNFVADTLVPFYDALSVAQSSAQAAQALYQFLIQHHVDTELLKWRDQWIETGNLAKAAEPEQTWETFVQMLDEFVDILGDHPFVADNFMGLLNAGFEGATYSQIPSTLDQVLISESGMVQMNDRKIVFIMGATDRVMPEQINNQGFLDDEGKQQVADQLDENQFLRISNDRRMQQEPYLNYLTFMIGNSELIFSYPKRGNDGNEFKLSPYVDRIAKHFKIEVKKQPSRPDCQTLDVLPFVGSKRSTLSHLVQYARALNDVKGEVDIRWNIVFTLLNQSEYHELTQHLLGSLAYKNIPKKLKSDIVTQLYGDTIYASVSKLEEFYRNEYSYFLKYGLKLQERETSDLSPADTGQYFHAAMDEIVKIITQINLDFNELNNEQIQAISQQVIDHLQSDSQFDQFNGTYRMGYLQNQLNQTVQTMISALMKQLMQSKMRPIASEQMFGQIGTEKGLPALNFRVDDEHAVNVRGKIDRIDKIQIDDQQYLGVVDYKSSNRDFNFTDAYYGLAMQMLMYLDVVQRNQKTIDPGSQAKLASALYMIFQDPLLKAKEIPQVGETQDALFKKFALQGFMLNDPKLLEGIDQSLDEQKLKSDIYPIRFTKSGGLMKSSLSKLVSEDELQNLIQHAELKVIEAGKRIFAGELNLNPVQWPDHRTALEYSPYKEIMQFDAMLPENNYRTIQKLDKEDVLKKIEEERKKYGK